MEEPNGTCAVDQDDIAVADVAGRGTPQGAGKGLRQGRSTRVDGAAEREQVALGDEFATEQEVVGEGPVLGYADSTWPLAEVHQALAAGKATATAVVGRHEDAVAHGGPRSPTGFHHRPGHLMARGATGGVEIGRVMTSSYAQVCPADRARLDMDDSLALAGVRLGALLEDERPTSTVDERPHQRSPSVARTTGRPSNHERLAASTAATAARPSAAAAAGATPLRTAPTKLRSSSR